MGKQPEPKKAEQASNLPSVNKQNDMRTLLEAMKPEIARCLPRHLTPERMTRIFLTCFRENPKLLECDQKSLLGCIMEMSRLGLEPGGILGHAHMIPYRDNKKGITICQFIPGYKGLIDLARRSGRVLSIAARAVHEKDTFNFTFGKHEEIKHTPFRGAGDAGDITHFYAVASLRDGGSAMDVMSTAQVNEIRDKVYAWEQKPWKDFYEEMGKKTVIRRLCKYLPLSPEIQRVTAMDEMREAGTPIDLGKLMPEEDIPPARADAGTEPPRHPTEGETADKQEKEASV